MFYITESGRVVNDKSLIGTEKFIESKIYPVSEKDGIAGIVVGIDVSSNKSIFDYPIKEDTIPIPTKQELIMQILSELELQNLEAQRERQLLAQQISDLELSILEANI